MSMIPETALASQSADWKIELGQSLRSRETLLEFCQLPLPPDALQPGALQEDRNFTTRVTPFYASLIEKGNPQDPLLLQVLTDRREFETVEGYTPDAVGDVAASKVPGLLHKYRSRALLTLTAACPIHCRYCFRRHFPYADNPVDLSPQGAVMQYLQDHPQIDEVILSGGDPLMWSDQKLTALMQRLNNIPHITTLRIHSRLLSVLPQRLTPQFIDLWRNFRGNIVFITHINHARELNEENGRRLQALSSQGYQLLNQSVLLKGVNDSVDRLANLSRTLFKFSILPYYLHRLDKVQGAAHFDLDESIACRIHRQLAKELPGYLLPRLVKEIAGQPGKTSVQCG